MVPNAQVVDDSSAEKTLENTKEYSTNEQSGPVERHSLEYADYTPTADSKCDPLPKSVDSSISLKDENQLPWKGGKFGNRYTREPGIK